MNHNLELLHAMTFLLRSCKPQPLARFVACAVLLLSVAGVPAQPVLVSSVPPNMATGVSPTASVVFTFSEAMNPAVTMASFMDTSNPMQPIATLPNWSGGNKVLTCTPVVQWVGSHMIFWTLTGASTGGMPLDPTNGLFTAGAASTGCDTNATMPSFTVSKSMLYTQTSSGPPLANASAPYCFLGCTTLSCPRNATNVTLQAPGGVSQNMTLSSIPGHLTLPDCGYTNAAAFEAAYTNGNYLFNIQALNSNQPVTINFPSYLAWPPAPHLTNFVQGQSINPSSPFRLGWDPFTNGTAADCIYVEIYGGVFRTPELGSPGASNGLATSVVIPAGTFQANQTYSGIVTFYHYSLVTNPGPYISLIYRASGTEFTLNTMTASPLVITNWTWTGGTTFSFEVTCSAGVPLVAECRTNPASGLWQLLGSTNPVSTRVRFTHPNAVTNKSLFYRVRTGL